MSDQGERLPHKQSVLWRSQREEPQLHIGFRTSDGRGEFEVVGSQSGYTASSLEGWSFKLAWPDGVVRDAQLAMESGDSKKPRLRSQATSRFQIGRMVAAMLLLPDPGRDRKKIGEGAPLILAKRYWVSRVGFGPDTEFTGFNDLVTIMPSYVELRNKTEHDAVGVEHRWSRINSVYAQSASLPVDVRKQVEKHREYMKTQSVVTAELVKIVRSIGVAVAPYFPGWSKDLDSLPQLEALCGTRPPVGPSLPPPDELGENEPDASIRSAFQYRQAKMRGSAARDFARRVRIAYGHRCVVCGARFGGLPDIASGIDAAHILAWSKYELDVVANGLALCKLHHWALDAALFVPAFVKGQYLIRLTARAKALDSVSRDLIVQDGFVIPDDQLPANPSDRPSPKYLQQLHADLAVEFIA